MDRRRAGDGRGRPWRPVVRLLAVAAVVAATVPVAGGAAQAQTLPSLSVADMSVAEGTASVTMTVTLSAASTSQVTVDYASSDDTATAGSDYTAVSGTLTFAAGDTTKTVSVTISDDSTDEDDETFKFTLSDASGATISDSEATVTITDNDDEPELSVDDVSVAEGAGTVTVTVELSAASAKTVTVNYATSDDTAMAGSDYTTASGSLSFSAGDTSKTVSVTISDDSIDEDDETFKFTLSGESNATIDDGEATVTITDDDDPPELSVGDETVAEGGGSVTVTVSLSAASAKTVTVNYATSDDTAMAGSDYTTASGSLSFSAGDTSKTVSVTISDDSIDEDDETFKFTLSGESNATIDDGEATVTITDDDPPPSLSVADETVKEGAASVTVTVSLSAASGKTVTVNYATGDGTAVAPGDYTAASGMLTFAPGDTSKTVMVAVVSDTVNETDEAFTFTLSGESNATLGTSSATVTIEDNPTLTVDDVTTAGESGNATLTVSLDVVGAADVTVNYATSNGTAVEPGDYTATSGMLTIDAGDMSGTVQVPITHDTTDEHDEMFTFTLSGVAHASISDGEATVTITDDDPPPSLSVADVTVKEGVGSVTVTVSLSAASGKTVMVNYATGDGTAVAPGDYTAESGMLTFAPGDTSKTVMVAVVSDTVNETDENFTFTLSGQSNATLGTSSATVTIEDNPTLTVDDVTVGESGSATLTVSLDVAGAADVTVNYATADVTAVEPGDYTATSGSLTVDAGDMSGTVQVPITHDTTDEHDETFTFTLSGVAHASISDAEATVTITDDDPPPALSVADVTVAEDAGSVTVTVSLSAASGKTVMVNYATADVTAVEPGDYTATSGTLTFAPGDTSMTVSVTIISDTTDEHDETFTFTLSGEDNATIGDGEATVTITDDDLPPELSVADVSVAEAAGSATMTVSLSAASGKIVTVDYATADGTAVAPGDYTATSGSLEFTPGDTSKQVPVTIISDTADEDDETFTFTLSGEDNATLATASATVTIGDNPTLSVADVEIDEDAGTATFTVSLDAPGVFELTVGYATADVTAKAPGDYTATSGTLTFTAGTTSHDVEVTIVDDGIHELNENFAFTLSDPTNVSITRSSAEGLIIDNEEPETRSAPPVFAVFEVRLSAAGARDVSVDYATFDGTAIAGVNYLARTGVLTIPAGERQGAIRVPILDDAGNRPHLSFGVRLSDARNARLRDARATAFATIRDGVGILTIGDATATEGGIASFPVTLSAPSDEAVELDYLTAGETAVAGADYAPRRGRLIIPAGRTEATIRIRVADDRIDEPTETFALRITGVVNARGPSEPATGTILDNDSPPVLTVADVTASEDAGHVAFIVTLSAPSGHFVTADFTTLGRTATAGVDYTVTTGTLIIPPGWTSVIVRVPISDDEIDESDETFSLRLANPGNATLGATTTATATITDDDDPPILAVFGAGVAGGASSGAGASEGAAPVTGTSVDDGRTPTLTVADASAAEGDGAVGFTVVLDFMSDRDVTVDYATSGGTATAGEDYTPVTGTVTIPAGSGAVRIRVPVADDSLDEPAETLTVTLSAPANATLAGGAVSATGTIVDDDDPPGLTAADATVSERDRIVTFTVTLDAVSGRDVTVDYATSDGTATAGEDYVAVAGTLTIPAGDSGATIVVPVLGDARDERNETFTLTLSGAQNAVVSRSSITATIADAVATTGRRPMLVVGDAVAAEGSGSVTLRVSLSRVSGVDVTVEYQTVDGTATSPSDFSRTSGTVTVPAGQRSATILVPITGDDLHEPAETFMLVVTAATNADLPLEPATVTILDDDAAPYIEIVGVTIEVGEELPS